MTHPSIQGLREAVEGVIKDCVCEPYDATGSPQGPMQECPRHGDWRATAEAALIAQAAYLTEHGVLLSGEGLVRATQERLVAVEGGSVELVYRYRLVPQDGEWEPSEGGGSLDDRYGPRPLDPALRPQDGET